MKVAIVHYWLVNMRGGERVLEALLDIYPDADIYTHVVDHTSISAKISRRVVATTFIQKLPGSKKLYQNYLPLMPMALEQLNLQAYDLIISSESGPAKGVIVRPDALHVCYCHSPMRYLWDQYYLYHQKASWLKRWLMPPLIHQLRIWDQVSAQRVDSFIANSTFVSQRINKYYRRPSKVIFPPVNIDDFSLAQQTQDYYLMVGQLTAYKNPHLAIEAFNHNGKPLIVIGDGECLPRLQKQAKDNIRFLGYQPYVKIKDYYRHCKAVVFPAVEDFGMVPVEAMASGRPVIALKKGGALDTVCEALSGVFFSRENAQSLNQAIEVFEQNQHKFDPGQIRQHSKKFDVAQFKRQMQEHISGLFTDMR